MIGELVSTVKWTPSPLCAWKSGGVDRADPRGGGDDRDSSDQVGGVRPGGRWRGLQRVVLMGETISTSCLCGWFQVPLWPHTCIHSTDFLTFHFGGLFGLWGPFPSIQCGITPGQKCPCEKPHRGPQGTGFVI